MRIADAGDLEGGCAAVSWAQRMGEELSRVIAVPAVSADVGKASYISIHRPT
jgi:hypothetical protein